jgi:hypothetical protein
VQALIYHGPGKRAWAYDTFGNPAKERALKVILRSAWPGDSR